jgi:hypothetical protein
MEQSGGSVGGKVGIPMANWLMSFGENRTYLPEVIEAMLIAHKRHKGFEARSEDFNAYITGGGFVIDCPGNACGLNPEEFAYIKRGKGFRFSCHNVDNAFQQMLLLVGLAALCDRAKREIEKTT